MGMLSRYGVSATLYTSIAFFPPAEPISGSLDASRPAKPLHTEQLAEEAFFLFLLLERGDGFFGVVVDIENLVQPRDLENLAYFQQGPSRKKVRIPKHPPAQTPKR